LVRHEENKTLGTSLRWLFEVGRGATRQLLTYHEVRQPDLVTGAFFGATGLGLLLWMRGHRFTGCAVPVGFVLAAGAQHVRSRFEISKSHWSTVAPAIAIDSGLLTAYFAGRLVGLATILQRIEPEPQNSHARAWNYPQDTAEAWSVQSLGEDPVL
jgi:hypothetical protein